MIRRIAFAVSFAFVAIIIGPVQAEKAQANIYLPIGSVDAKNLIPAPPKVGSPAFEEQMAIVLWLQHTRTPEDVRFVEMTLNVERFAPILGTDLFDVDAAALKRLINAAIDEVRQNYDALKGVYDLPRPFKVSAEVKPVGDARPVAAYPSGHAIRAIVYARLLAYVFPDRKEALIGLAHRIGYGRVVAGLHYPVDVTSGQILGTAYADAIIANDAFKAAVARVRSEAETAN
jgi:acid phosphatase (class A)